MIRLALIALILAGAPAASIWAAPVPCPAPADLDTDGVSLLHVAALLKPGATLNMLAIGSGAAPTLAGSPSTGAASPGTGKAGAKPAANAPAPGPAAPAGLPWQVAHALEAAVRGLHVGVTEVGHRGMTAEDMLGPMRDALAKKHTAWCCG